MQTHIQIIFPYKGEFPRPTQPSNPKSSSTLTAVTSCINPAAAPYTFALSAAAGAGGTEPGQSSITQTHSAGTVTNAAQAVTSSRSTCFSITSTSTPRSMSWQTSLTSQNPTARSLLKIQDTPPQRPLKRILTPFQRKISPITLLCATAGFVTLTLFPIWLGVVSVWRLQSAAGWATIQGLIHPGGITLVRALSSRRTNFIMPHGVLIPISIQPIGH